MASFEQIVKFETEKPNGVVRLVEANGFYRAYNHSAYLFHQAIARHKVTKKFVKNINQQLVYIGFPVDKLLERIGARSHKKTEFGYDVELAVDELPSDEGYDKWRETVPTEAASRGDANSLSLNGEGKRRHGAVRSPRATRRINMDKDNFETTEAHDEDDENNSCDDGGVGRDGWVRGRFRAVSAGHEGNT